MGNILNFIVLAIKRKKTVEDYFKFQEFQAKLLIKKLKKYGLDKSKRLLDIGSGIGGFISELANQYGSLEIYSLDKNPLDFAKEKYRGRKIFIVRGDATAMPFKPSAFDMVLASSVIEHVENQSVLLDEMHRVLKNGSTCYVSFPPFYSPVGGHSISPLHYLPGGLPFLIYKHLYRQKYSSFKNYGLVKTTIRRAKDLMSSKFEILDITPRVFGFLKPLLNIPIVREFAIHHAEFILRKSMARE